MRYYNVIYDIIDDVRDALTGMLKPELRENILGYAEVRDTFTSPKFGLIAGSIVTEGTIYKSKKIRVLRSDVVIYEGELESLRALKMTSKVCAKVRNVVSGWKTTLTWKWAIKSKSTKSMRLRVA